MNHELVRRLMLQATLICLVNAALVLAQSRQRISLNSPSSFDTQNLTGTSFLLPRADILSVSVALCSGNLGSSTTRFFVTNASTTDDPGPEGGIDVFELNMENGLGVFQGVFTDGGILAVDNEDNEDLSFQIGASNNGPLHETLDALPLFGDTTANQALLFSPPFDPPSISDPTYPNYTLPIPGLDAPSAPSTSPNFTLVVAETSASTPLTSLQQTACRFSSQRSSGSVVNESLWLRDSDGWRTQWILNGLTSQTNYTAYVIQDSVKLSGPIYFTTKTAAFNCPLVASLPYCPRISYAIPLSTPQTGSDLAIYDSTNLPSDISKPLIGYLGNFTTSLTTFACGRDYYSPLKSCADCQREYQNWLCTISFPRCGETSTSSSRKRQDGAAQDVFVSPALASQESGAEPRNPNFPAFSSSYELLLPCLETCFATGRARPAFLGFGCPDMNYMPR
ncbi:stretch-activated cation channel mid1 [Stygiomarasmius scandens]|uniref:Stretch-activated cation channel mid1 n=1 Tax=Marasmiellus scandens TaxID=2682957 RepID=A0ABR1K485_9AGAR